MNNSSSTNIRRAIGVFLLFFVLLTLNAGASIITVCKSGCNYTTVQGAINNASAGDTIIVRPGSYNEVIDINRSICLIGGESSETYPHIGKYTMPVAVTISAPNVTFDGFDIHGAGEHAIEITASHITIKNIEIGIHRPGNDGDAIITGSGLSDVTITNSNMQSTGGYGIYFINSQGITLKNNLIMVNGNSNINTKAISGNFSTDKEDFSGFVIENNTLNGGGIDIYSSSSGLITFPEVRDIIIHRNTITEPGGTGIYVGGFRDLSGEYHFFNATITQNTVTDTLTSHTNLEISAISGGVIKDNSIRDSNHGADGISLENLDWFTIQGNTVKNGFVNPLKGTVGFNLVTITNSTVSGNTVTNVTPFSFRYAPGPNFLPNLTFDSTNTADGKSVLFYEGANGITIDGQHPAMVIMLSCSNMKITNSIIENSGLGIGIYNSTGTTVSGTLFQNTNTGMMLIQSADSVIQRNTFRGSFMGLGVGDNTNARISGNNFSEYTDSGIVVHTGNSDNVMITENTLIGSLSGLEQAIVTSDTNGAGVTVAHNTMEDNTRGLLIYFTTDLTYLDNTIKNSGVGINLNAAQDNIIRNNTIQNEGRDSMGVYMFNNLTFGGGLVVNNQFTNNYILSETPLLIEYSAKSPNDARMYGSIWGLEIQGVNASIVDEEPGTINFWNVTKTEGTNIVKGPFLGGNYWAMPNGSGWSQTHPDRGDGFCNAPFVYDANNTDYLPLHYYPEPPVDYMTIGTYRNGVYYLRDSNSAGPADQSFAFGTAGDIPVTGHWEGLGITTIGVYSNGVYSLRNSNSAGPANRVFAYGTAGDTPVTGDWSGSGINTIGTYRNGVFYLRYSNTAGPAELTFAYGATGDIPVTGDWTGAGIDTVGIYRNGIFYLKNVNGAGNADLVFAFGTAGDTPVTGDWNGDGITTIGTYRDGTYYLRNSNTAGPADLAFAYGSNGDIPVTGKWV